MFILEIKKKNACHLKQISQLNILQIYYTTAPIIPSHQHQEMWNVITITNQSCRDARLIRLGI